jgi:hypothetical protein
MDPTKRKIYDTLGEKAVHYIEQPQSISYTELLANLSRASCWSRTKLNLLVFLVAGLLVVQPILICINIDRTLTFGEQGHRPYWPWTAVFVPLWCFNIFIFDYFCSLFISLQDGDGDDASVSSTKDNWVKTAIGSVHGFKRYQAILFLLVQFILIVITEMFLALKLDGFISWPYQKVFIPLFLQQALQFLQGLRTIYHIRFDMCRMITISQLTQRTGKAYADLTDDERRILNTTYIIVHIPHVANTPTDPDEEQAVPSSPEQLDHVEQSHEYLDAKKAEWQARLRVFTVVLHAVFLGLLISSLESSNFLRSWWLIFLPIILLLVGKCFLVCYQAAATALFPQKIYVKKESSQGRPSTPSRTETRNGESQPSNVSVSESSMTSYHTAAKCEVDDVAAAISCLPDTRVVNTPAAPHDIARPGTEEHDLPRTGTATGSDTDSNEKGNKEGEDFFYAAGDSPGEMSRYASRQCVQLSLVLLVLCLFIGKLEGATFSSFWVIFPLLLPIGTFVSCFCCAVYCVTDIGEDEYDHSASESGSRNRIDERDEHGLAIPPPTAFAGNDDKMAQGKREAVRKPSTKENSQNPLNEID